jgi:peptidoglycan hydrolase-like protein with peptidoglycan-binding domain
VPVTGYYQASTQAAVYSFQAANGLPQTGNLDVPTWPVLLQHDPMPVRWTKGGAVAAGSSGVTLPPPRSAKLPAVRDEIPPPRLRH